MKTKTPKLYNDSDGIGRWWAWTHRHPLAIEGLRRKKYPDWHAFSNEPSCRRFVHRIDICAKLGDEVGFGIPPDFVIVDGRYEEHY